MPTLSEKVQNLDKTQLAKASRKLAVRIVTTIAVGVVVTVAVTLISGAVLNQILPTETAE